jgi:hypothetical protein
MNNEKQTPVCPECGSEDISTDAAVRWDNDKQDWIVSSVFGSGSCGHCETEFKDPDWK